MSLDHTMPKVSWQLNFSHTNVPISIDHSIGIISVAEIKWCVSVDGNIYWENSPNSSRRFQRADDPKNRQLQCKNLGFGDGRFLQKS